ncbi:hypothetical protein JCM3766R1_004946 [Sporobolomyces carnicolor]
MDSGEQPTLQDASLPIRRVRNTEQAPGPPRATETDEEKYLAEEEMGNSLPYRGACERYDQEHDDKSDHEKEEEDSPYPEVRASVPNIDDPEMPVLTFRAGIMGIFFCVIIAALNTFFSLRYPAPLILPIITQILSYPLGKLFARSLPVTPFEFPPFLRRFGFSGGFSLNPGPFNIKEHTLLVIMANASTAPAFGVAYSLAAEKFYDVPQPFGSDVLLLLTTQMLGFGIAGVCRRFLVWPASMIWPQNLVFCTLLNTFHAEDEDAGRNLSRFKFFLYVGIGAFVWYWLPGFIFTALSAFSWVCWIAPNNIVVNQLFGVSSGLGMGLFTFDWSQISYIGSPLVIPWWAEVNVFCGFVLAFWIMAPIMYYTNVWDSAYLPISSSQVFDRFGLPYNTSAVIDPVTLSLNETAYRAYSPLYLPITFATTYGITFMLSTAVLVHTALCYGKTMWAQLRRSRAEEQDVHLKLMRNYPEVPDWWYISFLAIALGLSIANVAVYHQQLPIWALLLSLLIAVIYVVPSGVVLAMTTAQVSVNLIVELIAGYVVPGRALANMLFKTYATTTVAASLTFVQDLKIGHYMKIPPRATFIAQVASTSMTCFVQVAVKRWLGSRVPDLCSERQSARLICPGARVLYSSSIFWGLIGPARQFKSGEMYNPILYWLLAGAVIPVPIWLLARKFPRGPFKYISVPVALTGAGLMPPATGINYSSWFLAGFFFQYFLRRRQFRWWSKFNFVLSAALDSGTVLSGIFIFLTLSLPKNGSISFDWWGNTVYTETLDWAGASYKTPPPEGFGRRSW